MMRDRNLYHPIPIGGDLVRKNVFEFIIRAKDTLRIMCKTLTIVLPKTNAVAVPWIGGVMQLAGRASQQYTFNATFLVGIENQFDTWKHLYNWREEVFNHQSGRIALASEYKHYGDIFIYDVTGDDAGIRYGIKMLGVWPTDVQDITLAVEDDTPLEVSATFACDKIHIEKFYT